MKDLLPPDGVHEVGLSGAIWSDDGGEGLEGPESPEALVGLEILELDELQLSRRRHLGDGASVRSFKSRGRLLFRFGNCLTTCYSNK